jgi:hypothetical protein
MWGLLCCRSGHVVYGIKLAAKRAAKKAAKLDQPSGHVSAAMLVR